MIVYSDDPKHRTFALKLDGKVELLAAFAPARLHLDRVRMGTSVVRIVRIEGKLADRVKLSNPRSSKPAQIVAHITRDDSGRPALSVKVIAGQKEQPFSGTVRVATGLAEPKELTLYVWGQASGDIVLERQYVFFPPLRKKRPSTVHVGIRSLSGKPFRVRKIEDPSGVVRGKLLRGGKPRLALTLTRTPKGTGGGKLRIHLDRKDQKVIEIRYGVRHAFSANRRARRRPVQRRIVGAK